MNDLMPPPRRRMPDQYRHALHQLLQQPEATAPALSRSTPWLAAAAVAAIAIGGYAVATTLGDDNGGGNVIAPAGGTSVTPPSPTPTRRTPPPRQATPSTEPPGDPQNTVLAPGSAYELCIKLVRQTPQEPPFDESLGRVVASTPDVTTVVVSNGTSAWACNVNPDMALSRPVTDSAPQDVDAGTFAFAFNVASNFGAGPGDLAWAGGVLPQGVSEITYVFPDGHAEPAVTNDGYWVMQYLSKEPWGDNLDKTDPVQVQLTGPGGHQTVAVPLGPETACNQVTHGC